MFIILSNKNFESEKGVSREHETQTMFEDKKLDG